MIVYRISKYLSLDGKGAAKQSNNRWNSYGTPIVYAAGSISLAKGEMSRRVPLNLLPISDFQIMHIYLPDQFIVELDELPQNWDQSPQSHLTQQIGDRFLFENEYLGLAVPSVYDKECHNFLINPKHPEFGQVKVQKTEPLYF
ncbi:MAG: RES family NAD+ phosphorylase [Cyclobacteriaceae bacterium]